MSCSNSSFYLKGHNHSGSSKLAYSSQAVRQNSGSIPFSCYDLNFTSISTITIRHHQTCTYCFMHNILPVQPWRSKDILNVMHLLWGHVSLLWQLLFVTNEFVSKLYVNIAFFTTGSTYCQQASSYHSRDFTICPFGWLLTVFARVTLENASNMHA
jgi:hypothetical protein